MANDVKKEAGTIAACILRIFANLIIVLLGAAGGVLSWVMNRDVVFILIGADVGLGIGFLISILIRCLAELSERSKTTENAATLCIPANTAKNSPQELILYKELLDQDVITQEEYDAKKKQILGI